MFKEFFKLFLSAQFLKFLFVGITAAAANWLTRFGFDLMMSFSLAVICAYAVGMTVAFILNAIFVFPNSSRKRSLQARDFIFINILSLPPVWAVSLGLNTTFLHFGLDATFSKPIAHGLALAAPMIVNFLFYKFVAFKEDPVE